MSIHPNLPPRRDSGRDQDEATRHASYQARREEVLRQRREREKCQGEEQARMGQEHPSGSDREKGIKTFFEEGDKGIRAWTLKAMKSSYDEFLIEDHHSADNMIQILFGALGRMKGERDAVISLISTLVKERSRIRAHMVAQDCTAERSKSLYRKVGLDENCPNHVLTAARRSFRVIFHPDTYPAHKREEAERRFKETEAIFEEIKRLRDP